MKKLIAMLLTLSLLLCALPATAEGALEAAAEAVQNASTIDDQLALLHEVSLQCAPELEAGGWETSLTCEPAQPLPEDLLPKEEMEEAELSVQDFEGAKLIAIYDDQGDYFLLGDWQVRIPEAMRAASLEEADAVLCLAHTTQSRDDYIGFASNRNYYAYVYRRGDHVFTTAYHTLTTPPVTGYGTLSGERLSLSDLWSGVRQWFYGVIEVSYPEGTATYCIIGQTCCLAGLEGEFTRYEIPAEVEGYPVVGIEDCRNDALEELVLPEGIVWIQTVQGENLRKMNFPSTLRRIEKDVPEGLDEMILNEGLMEIGDFALMHGSGEAFSLPSTLKTMGRGALKGADCSAIVVPEGVTALKDYFLMHHSRVLCVFVPASVTTFGTDLFDYGGIRIYTPEDSAAARLAKYRGYEWVPCERAQDMPIPMYAVEDGFEYAIVEGEAILTGYSGDETCVRVPDTLGGCPVAIVREDTFYKNDALRAVLFPDTVRKVEGSAVYKCEELEAVFIPASVTVLSSSAVYSCGVDTVLYAQEGSTAFEQPDGNSGWPHHEVWTPGAEEAWFPAE